MKNRPEEKIRVLHIVGSMGLGGIETMIMNLYRNLDRTRVDFDFAINGDRGGYYEKEAVSLGAKLYHLTKRSDSLWKNQRELYRIVRKNKYDILHFHTQNAFLTSLQILAGRLGGAKRIIVLGHSTNDWRSGKLVFLHKKFRHILYLMTDIRLACSKDAAMWLYGKTDGVEIVHIPVDCRHYHYTPEKYELLRRQEKLEGKRVYIHVGRFSPEKNHKFLIEVFREIYRRERNSILILVGDGQTKDYIKNLVCSCGLSEAVRFTGNISDVYNKMIMADVFLLPSFYEGFPTVVVEARAAGLVSYLSDAVTPEAEVTDLVRRLPLETGVEGWAARILKEKGIVGRDRGKYYDLVKKSYDISAVERYFMKIYQSEGIS